MPGKPARLISVGNLQAGKGIDLVLRALADLNAAGHRDWTYRIIGDGPLRSELESLAASLGLTRQVVFSGSVQHQDVEAALREADIFVLPSWREAFGIAYLEAMACGLLTMESRVRAPRNSFNTA